MIHPSKLILFEERWTAPCSRFFNPLLKKITFQRNYRQVDRQLAVVTF